MTKRHFFSICIPAFNRKQLLEYNLKSIFDQTFNDYEIIIYDDHSSDATEKYCLKLAKENKNIRYYRNRSNLGFVGNLKKVMNAASGEYIFLMGDDDIIVPSCLSEYYKVLTNKKNNIGACRAGIFFFFQPNKENIFRTLLSERHDVSLKPESYGDILSYYATFLAGWAIRNEKPLSIGDGMQDAFIDTVFQQTKRRSFYYISKFLVGQGMSKNEGYSFYQVTSPWFELEALMKKYIKNDAKRKQAIIAVKKNMVNDCHNIKIYGSKTKLIAHMLWFFTDPAPKNKQLLFIIECTALIIFPNFLLLGIRRFVELLGLIKYRAFFRSIWK